MNGRSDTLRPTVGMVNSIKKHWVASSIENSPDGCECCLHVLSEPCIHVLDVHRGWYVL